MPEERRNDGDCMDKCKICFIRAKQKDDYVFDGIKKSGYKIVIPYKDYNLFLRICREIWFRLKLPKRELWINPETKRLKEEIIIIKDPLIVPEFVRMLRKVYPDKRIYFDYDNRVCNSIEPDEIREYADEVWHYDEDDCRQYNLRLKGHAYLDVYQVEPDQEPLYDVFYVGRDKGRLNKMDEVKEKLNAAGLKTYFHICATREFLTWTNKKYKHFLPYSGYLELLKKSRAILNIVPEGQTSITQREMEAVFDGVKCITNNVGIMTFELYDSTRFFVLNNNYEQIQNFLNMPFRPVLASELAEYRFDSLIRNMLGRSK